MSGKNQTIYCVILNYNIDNTKKSLHVLFKEKVPIEILTKISESLKKMKDEIKTEWDAFKYRLAIEEELENKGYTTYTAQILAEGMIKIE